MKLDKKTEKTLAEIRERNEYRLYNRKRNAAMTRQPLRKRNSPAATDDLTTLLEIVDRYLSNGRN